MDDLTVSYDASEHCPHCGSGNWLINQGEKPKLHTEPSTNRNDRACNDCGEIWPAVSIASS